MNLLPLASALVLAPLSSAFAITDADIAPAALVGKTLTFTIENGGTPFASAGGTWSGTFAASGNVFTAIQKTGDFVDISTTYSAAPDGTFTAVALAKIVKDQKPATLTLYTSSGVGHYEVSIQDLFGVSMNGTFTIGTVPPKAPEIVVTQGKSAELTDGSASRKNIGTARVGKSISQTFTIENTGTAALKNVAITVDGKNKSEFKVSGLANTSVAKNKKTSFVVSFKPKSIGVRNAAIHIKSNDKDESPFDIKLTGTGAGIK
ncbi:MAG: choice-of-anchor D domain-containing protein [Luteolibacter sp.]